MSTEYCIILRPDLMGILCGEPDITLQIGISSGGWCFRLFLYPSLNINSLSDWYRVMRCGRNIIRDEYERELDWEQMLDVIVNRSGHVYPGHDFSTNFGSFDSKEEAELKYLQSNMAEYGPNGLLRSRINERVSCIAHGKGTWDLYLNE